MTDVPINVADDLAERFAVDLTTKFSDPNYVYYVSKNSRVFDKIVEGRADNNGKIHPVQVHAFVERSTGKLVKAASYSSPQKNSNGSLSTRFNLSINDEYHEALYLADKAGGYLYKR
jgi:hypothetical protein